MQNQRNNPNEEEAGQGCAATEGTETAPKSCDAGRGEPTPKGYDAGRAEPIQKDGDAGGAEPAMEGNETTWITSQTSDAETIEVPSQPSDADTIEVPPSSSGIYTNRITSQPSVADKTGGPSGQSGHCLNCGSALSGKYCPECGQAADTRRLTFSNVTESIANSFISLERGAPRTLAQLFSRPGPMIREYIDGKRVSYVKPFSLLMALSGAYGILIMLIGGLWDITMANAHTLGGEGSELARSTLEEYFAIISGPIVSNLIMVPIYAWFSMRFFRKKDDKRHNFTEYCFITAYVSCLAMIVNMVTLILLKYIDGALTPLLIAGYAVTILLFAVTYKGFFNTGWWSATWRSVLIVLLSSFAFAILAAVLMIALTIKNMGV